MKPRSPVLGYNHNVRYANRLWHVQTEDSGVHNPHIFTHLFHNGTILATKRLDYDPAAEVPAVQKLMQTQHKAMLRELKAGAYDEKIGKYFGEPVVREAGEDSGEIQSGAFPVEKTGAGAMPAAAASPAAAPPPPSAPMPDEDSTVFDPYVPTAMREERASRGERVTNERMAAAPTPGTPAATAQTPAGSDTAFQKVRADMGSAPTMLAVPGASSEEAPRFRDTLSTPAPSQSQPPAPSRTPTAPRVPTPAGGVRERVPTPLGTATAKPSSTLPPARPGAPVPSGPPSQTELMARPPVHVPATPPATPAGGVKPPSQPSVARPPTPQAGRPPSQPSVAPPQRPSTQPQVGRPPSQPQVARPPTPSGGTPQVGRPPSQPGINRPVGGTTRPAPGRPTPQTSPRPGVPPSTVPAAQSRASSPSQGGGIGERRRSPSQPAFSKPTAEGVVVARPAVIIGGESSRAPAGRPTGSGVHARWSGDPQPLDPGARPSSDNIFGGDLISEKSLDEVILAYLSEDLNEK